MLAFGFHAFKPKTTSSSISAKFLFSLASLSPKYFYLLRSSDRIKSGDFMNKYFHSILLAIVIASSGLTADCPNKNTMSNKPEKPVETAAASYDKCLPEGFAADTVVSVSRAQTGAGNKVERETIKQRLDKMKAVCKDGKLLDESKKEIKFYQLQGCWGNPPQDYQEILDNQKKELDELKKKYAVVEVTCNASGDMPF